MKSTFLAFCLLVLTFLGSAHLVNQVQAAGDVVIATQSGATYLTTTTTTTTVETVTTTPTPIATLSGTPIPIAQGHVFLPPGFFPSANALVNDLFKVIMIIAVILVFAYLVLGGFQYITSGGEKGKTEAARNKMISAIVGLIIVASSYAILTIVLNFIGYRDVTGFLQVGPTVTPTPVAPLVSPSPLVTPTPSSLLKQLIK